MSANILSMIKRKKIDKVDFFIYKLDVLRMYMNAKIEGSMEDVSFDDYFVFVDYQYRGLIYKEYK